VHHVVDAGPEARPEPGTGPRRRHHPWRILLVAATLVGAVAFGYPTVRYAFRSHPDAKSMSSAVSEFRRPGTTEQSAGVAFLRPAAGVYRATGSGTEHISFPPNSQHDGAVIPVTVRHGADGCWRWRIDFNEAHWQEYDFCPQQAELLLESQRNFQSWDFGATKVENVARYTCDPPAPIVVRDPQPGTKLRHHCTGTSSAVPGTSTTEGPVDIVGTAPVTVGGERVLAIHQVRHQTISGAQRGTLEEEWWFAARTGLPLRASRDYRIQSSSPIGDITYTERGSWALESLEPVR
jgi:hypothetical protein